MGVANSGSLLRPVERGQRRGQTCNLCVQKIYVYWGMKCCLIDWLRSVYATQQLLRNDYYIIAAGFVRN